MLTQPQLAKQMGIRPNQVILPLDAPEDYLDLLGRLPEGVRLATQASEQIDAIHAFVHTTEELTAIAPQVMAAITPGCIVWIAYPKIVTKNTDLNRETMWTALSVYDWRPVTLVSLNSYWSAMRYRPEGVVQRTR